MGWGGLRVGVARVNKTHKTSIIRQIVWGPSVLDTTSSLLMWQYCVQTIMNYCVHTIVVHYDNQSDINVTSPMCMMDGVCESMCGFV